MVKLTKQILLVSLVWCYIAVNCQAVYNGTLEGPIIDLKTSSDSTTFGPMIKLSGVAISEESTIFVDAEKSHSKARISLTISDLGLEYLSIADQEKMVSFPFQHEGKIVSMVLSVKDAIEQIPMVKKRKQALERHGFERKRLEEMYGLEGESPVTVRKEHDIYEEFFH